MKAYLTIVFHEVINISMNSDSLEKNLIVLRSVAYVTQHNTKLLDIDSSVKVTVIVIIFLW